MNLTLKRFQISRTGKHRDSNGNEHIFTPETLQNVAGEYNARHRKAAPLYIGHPAVKNGTERTTAEPLGIVSGLEFENGNLYANAYVSDKLLNLVRSRTYHAVSAGFDKIRGLLSLNHIAFLNNPAIKDMQPLNFSDGQAGFLTFVSDINFSEAAPAFANESQKLDFLARQYQRQHPQADYAQAVRACLHLTDY
ncbi:hypothetical protein [Neisseria dentiae]|uniref:hypothetical protein n=1 Tax=Neisseria dentiae TaxID=194197 RepID=UPI00211D03FF|nr:hypothetical protein [Neisseria dentiae]MCQ9327133.1 hypothetical protein [Neisseria dentiae]